MNEHPVTNLQIIGVRQDEDRRRAAEARLAWATRDRRGSVLRSWIRPVRSLRRPPSLAGTARQPARADRSAILLE